MKNVTLEIILVVGACDELHAWDHSDPSGQIVV